MLTVWVRLAVLPAMSLALRVNDWFAPSFDSGTSTGQLAMPDRSSAHWNFTVTGVRFHPAELGAGATELVIVGSVRSIRTVAVCVASTLPALSTLQYSTVWTPCVPIEKLVPVSASPPSTVYLVVAMP